MNSHTPASVPSEAMPALESFKDTATTLPHPAPGPEQMRADKDAWLAPLDGLRRFTELRQRLAGNSLVDGEKAAWASLGWGTEICLRRLLQAISRRAPLPQTLDRVCREFFCAFSADMNDLMQSYVAELLLIFSRVEQSMRSARPEAAYLTVAQGSISLNFPKIALWAVSLPVMERHLPEEACGTLLRVLLISEGQAKLDPTLLEGRDLASETLTRQILEALAGDWTDWSSRVTPIVKAACFGKPWDNLLRTYRL